MRDTSGEMTSVHPGISLAGSRKIVPLASGHDASGVKPGALSRRLDEC